jgi:hypothetical protein
MCIETILYARTRHGIVNIENGILISNEAIESAWLKWDTLVVFVQRINHNKR